MHEFMTGVKRGVTLTLHGTHCIHTSTNVKKKKKKEIRLLYLQFIFT